MRYRLLILSCALFSVLAGCGLVEYMAGGGNGPAPKPKGSGAGGVPDNEGEWIAYGLEFGLWVITGAASYVAGDRLATRRAAKKAAAV